MSLAVVLPSRGLVYSQTVDELLRELDGLDYRILWSHGRPIPDCFNVPTEEALAGDYSHVLFIEEDMVLTPGIVRKMLDRKTYAVACDYPVGGSSGGTVMYDPEGAAFFTGCGLLLVESDLLRRMPKPIWRTDVRWRPTVESGIVKFEVSLKDDPTIYGQQDVAFGLRLYANNLPIQVMEETIGQREMVTRGGRGSNKGFHVVKERMQVVQRTDLTRVLKQPLMEEIVIDGKIVKVQPKKLATLSHVEYPDQIRAGRAAFTNYQSLNGWLTLN